jgi:hypothetical protein
VELQAEVLGVMSVLASKDKSIQDEIIKKNGKYNGVL